MPVLRRIHRWVGFVTSIIMIFLAVTGIALQVDRWINAPPPKFGEREAVVQPLDLSQGGGFVDEAIAAQQKQRPGFAFTAIEISQGPAGHEVRFSTGGPFGPSIIYVDGAIRDGEPPLDAGWHKLLQDLHAGYLIGLPGEIISLLAGFGLLLLGISGLILHSKVWQKRWSLGKRNPFLALITFSICLMS